MLNRIDKLDPKVPITIMNGDHTWMDKTIGDQLKKVRENSYVKLEIIDQSGHHIHADNPDMFNDVVVEACNTADGSSSQKTLQTKMANNLVIQAEESISVNTQIVAT